MEFRFFEQNHQKFVEIISDELRIKDVQESLDIMATAAYEGCSNVLIHERNFDPSFFDLKTGIAGEILQKYSNYSIRLAIIGSFDKYQSKSLRDFIVECNRGRHIFFVPDMETAISKMS